MRWVCDKLRPVGEGSASQPLVCRAGWGCLGGQLGPPVGAITATWWTAQAGEVDAWEARRGCVWDRVPPAWTDRRSGRW